MRTQVAIIGGGPAGLLLSQLLNRAGIETMILERQSREHVLSRIRAGVLEWGTVETLRRAGVGDRMDAEGQPHGGCFLAVNRRKYRIDFEASVGKQVMIYGQTEITADLYAAQDALGTPILHGVEDVAVHGADTNHPALTYRHDGAEHRLECDYIAGCDGFHGVSRGSIPEAERTEFEKVYPFGWLGVLSETPPVSAEVLYANHPRGFALASLRSHMLARYYIQVPATEDVGAWSDEAFWLELRRRLPHEAADSIVIGPSIEKSIAPLRSFVCEPMRWGRLFLAGDAGHIVPPTGAKGLNLAVSDVHYLSEALIARYKDGEEGLIEAYSDTALARVWKAIRFSWWMTDLLHRFPDATDFDLRIQESELDYISDSEAAQRAMAENYTGLPY